jgi:hypothetical protein
VIEQLAGGVVAVQVASISLPETPRATRLVGPLGMPEQTGPVASRGG